MNQQDYQHNFKELITLILFIFLINMLVMSGCAQKKQNNVNLEEQNKWVESPDAPDFGTIIDTEKPNIFIVGDSISIGYTGPLKDILINEYDVFRPADNCRNSTFTLMNIEKWLSQRPDIDIIIWNNGLWDAVRADQITEGQPKEYYTNDSQTYKNNLIKISSILKKYAKKVYFVTTTDVPQTSGTFIIQRELELNQIAKESLDIPIIDLYDFVTVNNIEHTQTFDVHFTKESNFKIASFIAERIKGWGYPLLGQ